MELVKAKQNKRSEAAQTAADMERARQKLERIRDTLMEITDEKKKLAGKLRRIDSLKVSYMALMTSKNMTQQGQNILSDIDDEVNELNHKIDNFMKEYEEVDVKILYKQYGTTEVNDKLKKFFREVGKSKTIAELNLLNAPTIPSYLEDLHDDEMICVDLNTNWNSLNGEEILDELINKIELLTTEAQSL